nr:carbohydrate ABC transporter permease [Cohnella sp. WQ 127256]
MSVALIIILSSTTAFILTRYKFFGASFIHKIMMLSLFLPSVFALIPTFLLMMELNLLNKLSGLVLVYAAGGLPMSIFILAGFFKHLDTSFEESALLDGSSATNTYWKIIFPIAMPGIVVIGILNIISVWNEYPLAMAILSSPEKKTVAVNIVDLSTIQRFATDWGALFAGLVIAMLPVLIIYFIFQNKLIAGLTAGATKG